MGLIDFETILNQLAPNFACVCASKLEKYMSVRFSIPVGCQRMAPTRKFCFGSRRSNNTFLSTGLPLVTEIKSTLIIILYFIIKTSVYGCSVYH